MKPFDRKAIITKDGSHTLFIPELNETYHSVNGALTESRHVFIFHGLEHFHHLHPSNEDIEILEMGFGTGLNAILALEFSITNNIEIQYIGVDAFPVSWDIVQPLKYADCLDLEDSDRFLESLHICDWEKPIDVHPLFELQKRQTTFEVLSLTDESFDVIFFDAFAPSRQPEVWSLSIMEKMYQSLKKGGIMVTYCAQGQFKRNLKEVGFEIEVMEGPPGKKEMVRALKTDR